MDGWLEFFFKVLILGLTNSTNMMQTVAVSYLSFLSLDPLNCNVCKFNTLHFSLLYLHAAIGLNIKLDENCILTVCKFIQKFDRNVKLTGSDFCSGAW